MSDTLLDSIEEALGEVESSLSSQVERVAALLREVELAAELMRTGREQVALARATVARTRELKRSVNEQRQILATLRATLRASSPGAF